MVAINLLTVVEKSQAQIKRKVTLEEIWKLDKFSAESVTGVNSMKDGSHYTSLRTKNNGEAIVKYSYLTGTPVDTLAKSASLIPIGQEDPISIESYQFSPNEKLLLIETNSDRIYRHSSKEDNYVYNLKSEKLIPLSGKGKQQYATFSPTGNRIAFVRENNIYYVDLNMNKELQITYDGKQNEIINGATDWVYEEEFSFSKAFFWSPDGAKLAFYRFDEKEVKEYSLEMYGSLYPSEYRFKYPKAGEVNSKVTLHIYDLDTRKVVDIDLGSGFEYIPRIKWTQDPGWLSIQRMNRNQNHLDLLLANSKTGVTKLIMTETSDTYISITDNLTFLDDKQHFIWTSENSGYNHIYLYNIEGQLVNQITDGNWDVVNFLGIDPNEEILYYTSSKASPLQRHVYSVKQDGSENKRLSEKKGNNSFRFSTGFKYYLNYHTDANTPETVTLHARAGKLIRTLESNEALKDTMKLYDFARKEFFNFTTPKGYKLNGWMIKPPDFSKNKKYPVIMYVYGGPGSQTVRDEWGRQNYFWYQYLAQRGYIVASVDNRGTGARGVAFKKCTYKQLGNLETIDQIEAAKYFQSLPYVDKDRIGIQGWSYGGYMSSLCITKGAEYFKLAIAVAPVTTWRFYDTIYTERYMQTPQENPDGYDDNSPINHVDKLNGHYLLIHGMADDNVHFQNTVEMTDALISANKQFDLYIYPNRNHGIYGQNARLHLYTKMTDFILENL